MCVRVNYEFEHFDFVISNQILHEISFSRNLSHFIRNKILYKVGLIVNNVAIFECFIQTTTI